MMLLAIGDVGHDCTGHNKKGHGIDRYPGIGLDNGFDICHGTDIGHGVDTDHGMDRYHGIGIEHGIDICRRWVLHPYLL